MTFGPRAQINMRLRLVLLACGVAASLGAGAFLVLDQIGKGDEERWAENTESPDAQPPMPADQHDRLVPIKNGEKYYAIPLDAFDVPPHGEREGDFIIQDGILFVFSWPTMEGGHASETPVEATGQGANQIRVLTNAMHPGTSPEVRLHQKFVAHVLSAVPGKIVCDAVLIPEECPSLYSAGEFISHLADVDGLMHFARYDRPNRDPNFLSDIYVERALGQMKSFFICNRPTSARPGAICTIYFLYKSNWFEATFNFQLIPVANSESLQSAIQRKIDEFEGLGRTFKNSRKGGEQ